MSDVFSPLLGGIFCSPEWWRFGGLEVGVREVLPSLICGPRTRVLMYRVLNEETLHRNVARLFCIVPFFELYLPSLRQIVHFSSLKPCWTPSILSVQFFLLSASFCLSSFLGSSRWHGLLLEWPYLKNISSVLSTLLSHSPKTFHLCIRLIIEFDAEKRKGQGQKPWSKV